MAGQIIILQLSEDKLKELINSSIVDALNKHETDTSNKTVLNKNQVAKMLKKHPSTITGMCHRGLLKTTIDGRIPLTSVNEYLGKNKNIG